MSLLVCLIAFATTRASAQADDTCRAVLQLLGPDSGAVKTLFLHRSVAPLATPALSATLDSQLAHYYINHHVDALALKYMLASIKQAEASPDSNRTGWSYHWLGAFYKSQRDFPNALSYLNKALRLFSNSGNRHGLGSIYNGIGDVYENQGNYDSAMHYYRASLNTLQPVGDRSLLAWPYFNIGEVYMLRGINDSALKYYDSALAIQQHAGDNSGVAWTYNNISQALMMLHRYPEAKRYALGSLALADSLHEASAIIHAHYSLYAIYEATHDYRKALEHHKIYTALQAQVGNEETVRAVVKHQMQYDFDKQQQMDKLKQQDKDRRNAVLAICLFFVAATLGVIVYQQRRSNSLKADLLRQEEATVKQKELLMKEMHHRVKNNLQVTGALLDAQMAGVHDVHARDALRDSITRLNAISLIHHQLYRSEETAEIEFAQFANSLQGHLHDLFARPGQQVQFINNLPPTLLDLDTAVPLGLILNELITNSYKHAFSGAHDTITLHMAHTNDHYMLTYYDRGPGLKEDQALGGGLGTVIISTLSRQVGGEFRYDRHLRRFIVSFRSSVDMKRTA